VVERTHCDQVVITHLQPQPHEEGIRAAIMQARNLCELDRLADCANLPSWPLADADGVKTQIGLQRQLTRTFRVCPGPCRAGLCRARFFCSVHVSVDMFGDIVRCRPLALADENFMSVVAIWRTPLSRPLLVVGKP